MQDRWLVQFQPRQLESVEQSGASHSVEGATLNVPTCNTSAAQRERKP